MKSVVYALLDVADAVRDRPFALLRAFDQRKPGGDFHGGGGK